MKKLFFTLFCVSLYTLHAQVLYTTTSNGGNGGGTISRLEPATGMLTADFAFDTQDGEYAAWHCKLVQAADNKLYGMTYMGGSNNNGTIFSYNTATSTYTKLYNLDWTTGGEPMGSLIEAKDGKLYGMTNNGGMYGRGVIFSFNPGNAAYTKLFDFNTTNGEFPHGSLMQASDGKLYGMTVNGGTYDYGVVFSYNIKSGVYTKLKDFDGSNGKYPSGDFIQESDGKLYAMTSGGGSNDLGAIFSYNPATLILTKLKDFDNSNGSNPMGSFLKASDGKFYSMTLTGGNDNVGVIFSYDPTTGNYAKLKDFNYTDGARPDGSLMQMPNGTLYGMTTEGGNYYRGALFSYKITTATYTKLKDFDGTDGANPYGSLTRASDGKLYSLTYNGGKGDRGVMFAYSVNTNTFTRLKDFGINNTGSLMQGGVVKDASGTLYGMTHSGGSNALGVLFSFNPVTTAYTKLLDFDGNNGAIPYNSLMLASNGKLYGMTYYGGANGVGVIFSFDPVASIYTKLKDLEYANGSYPYGNLVEATNGKFYGITYIGGINGAGDIFSFDPVTSAYTKLFDFGSANGASPTGSLMQAKDGQLYGVTYNGGTNDWGVLFSFNPATGKYKKLKEFDITTGVNPNGTLVQASDGKLYGMTTQGGNNFVGTIFSYDPSTGVYTKVKDFDYISGSLPKGSLVKNSDGKLYGMTMEGGVYGNGVAFSFDPVTATYTKIQDFNGTNGKAPEYTFFTEVPPGVTVKISNASIAEGNRGKDSMIFKVRLSSVSSQTVKINYKTQPGTAISPSDYIAKEGTLTFAPGVKKQTLPILIKGDTQLEGDEKFKVILSNPVNVMIEDSIGVGTILNDDAAFAGISINQESNSSKPSVTVSPNPATSIINIRLTGFTGSINLHVTDLQGTVLKATQLQTGNMKIMQQQFNIANLTNGTYFITVWDEKSKRTIKMTKE